MHVRLALTASGQLAGSPGLASSSGRRNCQYSIVAAAGTTRADELGNQRFAAVQRTCSSALEAVVVPLALDAVTLQLTRRRLRPLPRISLDLASFSRVPFTRHE